MSLLVSLLKLDACQSSIVELSRAEPDLSAKPESYKDLTVLSFAVSWESKK